VRDAVAKREGVGLRNMTDSVADDESAEYLEGDYLTVEQLARLRQVTPAAVRAQLRAGNLAGEQVLQGQRTVWRIPVGAARGYLGKSAGSSSPTPRTPGPPRPTPPPSSVPAPVPTPTPARAPAPARVEALEAEVRRLRRQLADLADAHRRLLDAVTSGLAEEG
jgi:hypothetical protein